jgi:hypothetical protein
MDDFHRVLQETKSILLIDYPGRVVPDSRARAGFVVTAHEGPGALEYCHYQVAGDEVVKGSVPGR